MYTKKFSMFRLRQYTYK